MHVILLIDAFINISFRTTTKQQEKPPGRGAWGVGFLGFSASRGAARGGGGAGAAAGEGAAGPHCRSPGTGPAGGGGRGREGGEGGGVGEEGGKGGGGEVVNSLAGSTPITKPFQHGSGGGGKSKQRPGEISMCGNPFPAAWGRPDIDIGGPRGGEVLYGGPMRLEGCGSARGERGAR